MIADLTTGMTTFSTKLDLMIPTAVAAVNHWYVPADVRQAVVWLATKTVEIGRKLLDLLVDIIEGAHAPIVMFIDAWEWMDVRGAATLVGSSLSANALVVDDTDWSGKGRDAYVAVAEAQSQAALRVSAIASSAGTLLIACAVAGLMFYALLVAVIVRLVAAAIAALTALGSAVFSWAGVGIVLGEAGASTATVGAAIMALLTFLGAQATAMVSLHGEAVDVNGFPKGRWPTSNASAYNDATVTDDDADWSLAD
ncbi:hypothetical protein WEI85_05850 [Actinomycetes bacterium KLBMP 9797]